MKSNITIAPNIYVRTSLNLQSDEDFIRQVYGHKALNILKARLPKSYAQVLTRAQLEEMKQNVVCRLNKTREHSFGKALNADGAVVWSCRCENIGCYAYEKCMELENAMRIHRTGYADGDYESDFRGDRDESAGFDPEECSFEPPHVAVVLPVLHKILCGEEEQTLDEQNSLDEKPESPEVTKIPREQQGGDMPAVSVGKTIAEEHGIPLNPGKPVKPREPEEEQKSAGVPEYPYTAESCVFDPRKRVLVICGDVQEAGYLSTLMYKCRVRHRILRRENCSLNRLIADMFWDYHDAQIEKDAFIMRCMVRANLSENEAAEVYDALYELCGIERVNARIGFGEGLAVAGLADILSGTESQIEPEHSSNSNAPSQTTPAAGGTAGGGTPLDACLLNIDDEYCPATIATPETLKAEASEDEDSQYDEILVLESESAPDLYAVAEELFGKTPLLFRKESPAGWVFSRSELGRPCRVALDNYKGEPGRHCLNVELGLWGDVDGKSFLAEPTGDAMALQNYIASRVREGDELTVEKDAVLGGYRFVHKGNVVGEFPPGIIREIMGIEGLPADFAGFEGVYVRNIVTCIAEKDDMTVPPLYRDTRFWLGLDITGYAKVVLL